MPGQVGTSQPYDVLGMIRKILPFTHSPFRNGQKDGRGQQVVAIFGSPNVDTTFALALGHVPEAYIELQKSAGGVVFNGSNQGSDWTPSKIVLRATVAGTYRLLVL